MERRFLGTRTFKRGAGVLLPVVLAVWMGASFGCDDPSVVVRERPDGGGASVDAGESGTLACGAVVPSTYESPSFATNAAQELDLRARAFEIDRKMLATEGTSTAILTSAELSAAFTAGSPSLRAVATPFTQSTLDRYFDEYGDAIGRTWKPDSVSADAGADDTGVPATGGKYDNAFHVSAVGLDLRRATARTLLGGAFYQHAVSLVSGGVSEATLDQLLASYGASTTFADRTDDDAGATRDALSAELASERDDATSTTPGFYRQIRGDFLVAKAAVGRGDACRADLDAALARLFDAWERTLYASAVYDLNAAASFSSSTPPKGAAALRSFGSAVGLIQGLRGVPQERRKITDAQIDALLAKIGVDEPYDVALGSAGVATSFTGAIQDIARIYGFSQSDVESFKKQF